MEILKFNRFLYSKVALLKAAYNYTDRAYIHLDADDNYYYVALSPKDGTEIPNEDEFKNELLAQSVRHEVYKQTKNIRELLITRAVATSVITADETVDEPITNEDFDENLILKDWFADNEKP